MGELDYVNLYSYNIEAFKHTVKNTGWLDNKDWTSALLLLQSRLMVWWDETTGMWIYYEYYFYQVVKSFRWVFDTVNVKMLHSENVPSPLTPLFFTNCKFESALLDLIQQLSLFCYFFACVWKTYVEACIIHIHTFYKLVQQK